MRSLSLSPELRFVFRAADPTATADELHALARDVRDWGRMLTIGEREGATPTLWRILKPIAPSLPAQAVTFLQARSVLQDFRMPQLATRLADAVAALRAREVPVLLLKGAAIGAVCDPTFRSRPMTDVDLLVHPADLPQAREALAAARWRQSEDPLLHSLLEGMQHEAPYRDATLQGVRLELHTAILPPDHSFDFPVEALWASAGDAPAPFAGARVPSAEHLVLHGAIHFAWQHQMTFGAWRTLRGIALLANRPGFDWSRLTQEATRRRAASSLYWTLRLAKQLVGFGIPAAALDACRPPTMELICAGIERHVIADIAPGEFPASPSLRVSRWLWLAAIRPGWSGHARAGRYDPEQRWARALGKEGTETGLEKITRHTAAYRGWMQFLSRTLLGR